MTIRWIKGVPRLQENSLIIRVALPEDMDQIWSLLHAAQISWNDNHIAAQLSQLYVLIQKEKMLGVLWGPNPGSHRPEWIIIHPMYPEKPFQDVMREGWFRISHHDGDHHI
jgi:hypothetical protein